MTVVKNSKGDTLFTNVPKDVMNEFLSRTDRAYHEADTVIVTTDVQPNSVTQVIVKLNSHMKFEYHID